MSSARVCDVCHEVIKGEFLKSARLVEWVWGGWSLFSDRRKIDVCGSCLEKIGAAVRAEHLAEKRHPSKPPEPPNVEGSSIPVVWRLSPLYCSVAEEPYVGVVPAAVAVPSIERIPFTVAPVSVLAPEPDKVRLL